MDGQTPDLTVFLYVCVVIVAFSMVGLVILLCHGLEPPIWHIRFRKTCLFCGE